MNIEPGTRVRLTDPGFTSIRAETGTYVRKMNFFYHEIHWDDSADDWNDLHIEDEFEVIDE